MKIVYTTGCICNSLTVDGVEEINLTDEQRSEVAKHIYQWMIKHPQYLNCILQDLVSSYYDKCKHSDDACECCGDYVDTFTWDI